MVLQDVKRSSPTNKLLKQTCLYSLLHTENALELLKIISIGMYNDNSFDINKLLNIRVKTFFNSIYLANHISKNIKFKSNCLKFRNQTS